MLTDDELRAAWQAGKSYNEIGKEHNLTKHMVSSRVRTLRKHEGEEAWPKRPRPIRPKRVHTKMRAGTTTLPPLTSLKGNTDG
jgi:hypothetical protein